MIGLPPFPRALYVGDDSIEGYTAEPWDEIDRDPRGVLLMWSPPKKDAKYVVGFDPTVGVTGWNRGTRADGDKKVDNGVIEVFEIDAQYELLTKSEGGRQIPDIDSETGRQKRLYKDVQVAEFAAPADAVETARVANTIGRLYQGEEEAALLIHEAWPGCGMLSTQELLRLGYPNLWMWQYIDSVAEDTNRIGWRSTRESQKLLWYRARRHIMNRRVVIRSKWLLGEYESAEIDLDKMRAMAADGFHDDRFMAANLCFWAGHEWQINPEREYEKVTERKVQDFQCFAPTLDDNMSYAEYKASFTADWD